MQNHIRRFSILLLALMLALTGCMAPHSSANTDPNAAADVLDADSISAAKAVSAYRAKAKLLKASALTDDTDWELGADPAGEAQYAAFISVSNGKSRAQVYSGIGKTVQNAWDAANKAAEKGVRSTKTAPMWVKLDLVFITVDSTYAELCERLAGLTPGFAHFGVSFDSKFKTALLESELNSAGIYGYGQSAGIDLDALNAYLSAAGRSTIASIPEKLTLFQSFGWFCDEANEVCMLKSSGPSYGRRDVAELDKDYVETLVSNAADYLAAQVHEDGSFLYALDPRDGAQSEDYNIVRHASAVWGLLTAYEANPSQTLSSAIDKAVNYLIAHVVYNDDKAYILDKTSGEIRLGASGLALVVLTDHMRLLGHTDYTELCIALGNGIVSMQDKETGKFTHVLSSDFTAKEDFRTVYYDGEATFGLTRLYGLTKTTKWLNAARRAGNYFVTQSYEDHCDLWIAYSMAELSKYVAEPAYYMLSLRTVQENLDRFETSAIDPSALEILMVTFETYDMLVQSGVTINGFDEQALFSAITARADRLLDGYVFPEYAMYFATPNSVLGAFMVREDGFRIRIDDIQHCISAYALYLRSYDRLTQYTAPASDN